MFLLSSNCVLTVVKYTDMLCVINSTICKSFALHCRQITTTTSHHSNFFTDLMLFLTPYQQCQSTEGNIHLLSRPSFLELLWLGQILWKGTCGGNWSKFFRWGVIPVTQPTVLLLVLPHVVQLHTNEDDCTVHSSTPLDRIICYLVVRFLLVSQTWKTFTMWSIFACCYRQHVLQARVTGAVVKLSADTGKPACNPTTGMFA